MKIKKILLKFIAFLMVIGFFASFLLLNNSPKPNDENLLNQPLSFKKIETSIEEENNQNLEPHLETTWSIEKLYEAKDGSNFSSYGVRITQSLTEYVAFMGLIYEFHDTVGEYQFVFRANNEEMSNPEFYDASTPYFLPYPGYIAFGGGTGWPNVGDQTYLTLSGITELGYTSLHSGQTYSITNEWILTGDFISTDFYLDVIPGPVIPIG